MKPTIFTKLCVEASHALASNSCISTNAGIPKDYLTKKQIGNPKILLSIIAFLFGAFGQSAWAQCPPPIPTVVTAIPSGTCLGNTIQLNALTSADFIAWYDAPSGGNLITSAPSGINAPVTPNASMTYYAEAVVGTILPPATQTFNFTGNVQTFVVPPFVTSMTIQANGAQGGGEYGGGGLGAALEGTFAVTPGETLYIVVGEKGHLQIGGDVQGSSGGGGGTFVYRSSTDLLLAAAGGGGRCNWTSAVPLHPDANGQAGVTGGNGSLPVYSNNNSNGIPGTNGNPGTSGIWNVSTICTGGGTGWLSSAAAPHGGLGFGSWAGGIPFCYSGGFGCGGYGGYGGGGGAGNLFGGGGGGGGYSGGAGGTDATHGGGGGSYNGGTSQTNISGIQTNNGFVSITYSVYNVVCVSTSRVPVSVTVDQPSTSASSISSSAGIGFCGTGSTTLSVNGGSLGSNANWQWYEASCNSVSIGSGASIPVAPSANTTYFVNAVSTTGYCPSTTCVNLDIFVNPSGIPTSPATISASVNPICLGGSTDLTTSSTGNMINWYDAPSGGNLLYTTFNSYPYTVLPTTTTTYYAEGVFGTYIPYQEFCTSLSRTPITIAVEDPSIDPTGISSTNGVGFCGSANTLLSVQGGSLGSNADWFWYSGTCGGNFEGNGATLNATPIVTTTYFVRAESSTGTCGNSNCATVTIVVNPGGPPAAPNNVTATPSNICLGNQTQLDGISLGNYVSWYDAPTGGNLLGTVASGNPFSQTPNSSVTYYAEAVVGAAGPLVTQTFNYSGVIDSWIVPNGVTSITVEAYGAQGGDCSSSSTQGAKMKGDFAVTPGQQLWILAGQFPQFSNYGGGGTFVATGATVATATPLLVAGGGGGSASNMGVTSLAPIGNDGNASYDGTLGGTLGNGSSSSNGGGGFYTSGSSGGSFVGGGNGGCAFGGGACGSGCSSYGGGGGGYSGGAGDNTGNGGGGGSFNSGTNQNNVAGYNNGNGYVTISYNSLATVCTSLTRTPVAVTVDVPSVEPTSILSSNGTGFCTVANSVLSLQGGSLGTNANWVWYSGSCGGTLEGTGPTLSVSPTSTTTYFARAESSTGFCANTNCAQITITVSPSGPPAAPITASATPNLLCQGTLVQLEASAPGNFITWYDAAVGGNSLGSTLSGGQLPITPSTSTSYYAEAVFGVFGTPVTETFNYTGAIVPWTVPANVTSITIEGFGAQGGECSSTSTQGARMKGDFVVTPGQQLWLLVGENPGGSNYGGGGTFVGTGSSLALSTPLLVAGGGGGSAGNMGPSALAPIGNDGNASYDGTLGGTLGNGSSSPNGGGGYYTSGTSGGSFVGGGIGGCAFGGGACGSGCSSYGGGGGGYSGGAGDNTGNGGGGGSFNIGTNQSNTPGDHSGHGLLTITYNTIQPICGSLTRTPVSVNVETSSVMPTDLTSSLGNCGDGITPTTLSIVGGTLGTNADWKWYTGSCGGNLVGSGPSLVVTPTVTTTYYLRSESTGPCPATTCDSITIILVEAPTAVTATPNVFCGAGPFASTLNATSTGNLINWYDVPSGGTPIAGGASVPSGSNVPVSLSATTTYYAEAQSIACSNNSLSNILSNLNTNATSISNTVPNPFNFAMDGGLNGTDIGDGGNDMYDGGNVLNTNFSIGFNYSDNTIINSSAFGTNGQFFTKKIDNMFVMAADLDGVTNFSITGNNGADGSGVADATSFPLTIGCTDYTVYLKRVHSAGDPSINQMIIIKNNPNVVHNFATNTDDTYHELTGLSGTTRMYYLLYAGDNGSLIDMVDYTNIATNFLTTVQANIGSTACVSTTRTPVTITVNPSCNTETLELTAFLQGYYTGASTMANVMAAQNYLPVPAANDVDDITVELHDATTFALVPGATVTARLQSDGTALCAIPVQPGNYYVVCKHRNHIQTWSADPITFSGTPVPYNFSTSSTQAFAGNMVEVDLGVWAFFSGDINQDEYIDGFDYSDFDTDSQNNVSGVYVNTDLNGDGYVDGFDYQVLDANSQNNVLSVHP